MRFTSILSVLLIVCQLHANHFDVLVIGDDISTSYQSSSNWVKLIKQQVSCPVEIYNASKLGATSEDGYETLTQFLNKHQAKVTVIELGSNDIAAKHKFSNVEKNLDHILQLLKSQDNDIILVGIELPPQYNTIYRQLFKSTFQRVAKKHNIYLVMSEHTSDPNLVELDQLRPNDAGHEYLFNQISPLIEKLACQTS